MTDQEISALAQLLRTHTAVGRVTFDELVTALRLTEARGYIIKAPAKVEGWRDGASREHIHDICGGRQPKRLVSSAPEAPEGFWAYEDQLMGLLDRLIDTEKADSKNGADREKALSQFLDAIEHINKMDASTPKARAEQAYAYDHAFSEARAHDVDLEELGLGDLADRYSRLWAAARNEDAAEFSRVMTESKASERSI